MDGVETLLLNDDRLVVILLLTDVVTRLDDNSNFSRLISVSLSCSSVEVLSLVDCTLNCNS